MTVRYEWKETRNGRRYTRTVVRDEPVKAVQVAEPVVIEPEIVPDATVEEVIEPPKRKPGRPRKVVIDE